MSAGMESFGLQRGPAELPGAIGFDEAPETRPGVPMEARPEPDPGAHWTFPVRQPERRTHYRRKGLPRLTPVFGTAQPPRGVSGLMRRFAYRRLPEHEARHWALLLAADRVDVLEGRIGRALARPIRRTPFSALAHAVEQNPLRTLAIASIAAIGTTMLIGRALD